MRYPVLLIPYLLNIHFPLVVLYTGDMYIGYPDQNDVLKEPDVRDLVEIELNKVLLAVKNIRMSKDHSSRV